jgi:hypothetical protein
MKDDVEFWVRWTIFVIAVIVVVLDTSVWRP